LKGEKHPMYGIPKTDEEKEKIRKGLEKFRKENPNADCNRKTIPVYCEELKMRFESIKEATDYMKSKYNLCMKNLTRNMKGLVSYCGVIMIDGKKTKLHWNYVNIEDKEFSSKLAHIKTKAESESNSKRMINNDYAKKSSVYCVELDITFKSITKAQKYIKENYNENCHNISAVCRGLRETCGIILLNGEHTKLHWKYI
jgi:aspartokinase